MIIESQNGSIEVKADYNRLKQVLLNLRDIVDAVYPSFLLPKLT
jgi:hypothetical protein